MNPEPDENIIHLINKESYLDQPYCPFLVKATKGFMPTYICRNGVVLTETTAGKPRQFRECQYQVRGITTIDCVLIKKMPLW